MRRERNSWVTSASTPTSSIWTAFQCPSLSPQQPLTLWEWEVWIQITTPIRTDLLILLLRRIVRMPMPPTKASARREATLEAVMASVLAVLRFQDLLRKKCFTEVNKTLAMVSITSKLTRQLQTTWLSKPNIKSALNLLSLRSTCRTLTPCCVSSMATLVYWASTWRLWTTAWYFWTLTLLASNNPDKKAKSPNNQTKRTKSSSRKKKNKKRLLRMHQLRPMPLLLMKY